MGIETAIIGGAVLGAAASSKASKTQASAAKSAAATQAAAADRAADLQYQMFQEQKALQEPWRQAGQTALNALVPLSTQYTPFGTQQFQQDPGYAFRLSEGQKALDRQAAARGGLISGAALKAAQRYGQEMGSQEYQNAFNRYQAERQARLGPLQSLAGVGQTSAQALAGQAGQYGANVGNLYGQQAQALGGGDVAAAQARASGYMGGANLLGSALGQYQTYQQNQAQNALMQQFINRQYPAATVSPDIGINPMYAG